MSIPLVSLWRNLGSGAEYIRAAMYDNICLANSPFEYRPDFRNPRWGKQTAKLIASATAENWNRVANTIQATLPSRIQRNRTRILGGLVRHLSRIGVHDIDQCYDCSSPVLEDQLTTVSHEGRVCETCLDENYVWSEYQSENIYREDAAPLYDAATQLRRGSPEGWVTRGNAPEDYLYSESHGAYLYCDLYYDLGLDEEDDENEEEEEENGTNPLEGIGDYHSSRHYVRQIPSLYDNFNPPLLMGLELEVECEGNRPMAVSAADIRDLFNENETYCATEFDGSLSRGFEIVTGWTGLDVHERILKRMKTSKAFDGLLSHNTETCGLHVHIDRENISPIHALRMLDFMHSEGNRDLIVAVARRYGTGYCAIVDKSGKKQQAAAQLKEIRKYQVESSRQNANRMQQLQYCRDVITADLTDRYEAINMTNARTIEFRIFRGTLKFETIMACLEFTRALWLFTRDHGDEEMTTAHFLVYIQKPENRRETRYLRHRLRAKKFDVLTSPRELETLLIDKLTKRKKPACVS